MQNFRVVRWLSSDDTAAVYEAAGPDNRPLIYTVGHRPAEPAAEFTAWVERLSLLRHPHLVEVVAAGLTGDARPFLLTGTGTTTLAERLVRTPPDVNEVARTTTAIADALDTVHGHGLRHGTVCPSTVVYAEDGTPMLTGFDMCAPSLTKGARPGLYTAPESFPGPAGDVYALAATAYVALGGTLPYVADPMDEALRRRGIDELPGVSPALTGMLRTALNPDPTTRPSAALLRDLLSTVETQPTGRTDALPVMVAGSDVRAASHGVASINQAVTGPHPLVQREKRPPMPDQTGQYPVFQSSAWTTPPDAERLRTASQPSVEGPRTRTPPPARNPRTAAPPSAPPTVRRRRRNRRILVAVLVLVLVSGGLGAAWLLKDRFADAGDSTGNGGTASPEGIEDVDFDNITFSMRFDGSKPMSLHDGSYTGTDVAGNALTWTKQGEAVYADVNADGEHDAAVEMVRTMGTVTRAAVLVFLWDGAAVQMPEVVNGLCSVTGLRGGADGFELDTVSANPYDGCTGDAATNSITETFTIGAVSGDLVQTRPVLGAVSRCQGMSEEDSQYLYEQVVVRAAPTDSSPTVDHEITMVQAHTPNTAEAVTWTLAQITYADGDSGCGWVAVSDLPAG